jgi:hypothetical protein
VSLCVSVLSLVGKGSVNCISLFVDGQQLGKNVNPPKDVHLTTEELLDTSFPSRSMSYRREVCDYYCPEILIYFVRFVQTWSPLSCCSCDPLQPKANCDAGNANWEYEDQPSRKIIECCVANWIPLLLESRHQVRPLIRPGCTGCTTARLNAVATDPARYPLRISFNVKVYYKLL